MLGLRPNSRTAWDNKQFMTSCAQLYLPPPPLYLSNLDQRVCSNFLIIVSLAYFRFHYAATLGVQFAWSQFYAAECFLPSPCSAAGYLRKLTQFYFCLVLNTQAVLLHCVKWQRARSVQWSTVCLTAAGTWRRCLKRKLFVTQKSWRAMCMGYRQGMDIHWITTALV